MRSNFVQDLQRLGAGQPGAGLQIPHHPCPLSLYGRLVVGYQPCARPIRTITGGLATELPRFPHTSQVHKSAVDATRQMSSAWLSYISDGAASCGTGSRRQQERQPFACCPASERHPLLSLHDTDTNHRRR